MIDEHAALLLDRRRHRADAEVLHEAAALVEVEAALAGLHQLERRARTRISLAWLGRSGASAQASCAGIVAVEEDERRAQRHGVERIDPRARGNDDPALVVGNVALDA